MMKSDIDRPKASEPKPSASAEPKPKAPASKPGSKPGAKPDGKDDLKTLPLPEVEKKLGSSPDGLTQAEAQKRLTQYVLRERYAVAPFTFGSRAEKRVKGVIEDKLLALRIRFPVNDMCQIRRIRQLRLTGAQGILCFLPPGDVSKRDQDPSMAFFTPGRHGPF